VDVYRIVTVSTPEFLLVYMTEQVDVGFNWRD
jgi:hypothetical protein